MAVTRLNHAVLYVRDAQRTAAFFEELLGFVRVYDLGAGVFLRTSDDSRNDHDLAVFSVGEAAGPSQAGRTTVGMYHLAWEVPTLGELAALRSSLAEGGALVGQSDHGESKSLYCVDPDGLEFELVWCVPPDLVDPERDAFGTRALDLDATIERFGADTPGRVTA